MVECPRCRTVLDAGALLEACTVSWPHQSWVLLRCPSCNTDSHLQVQDGVIQTGFLDGAPGPCFIVENTYTIPGLVVQQDPSGVTLSLNEHRRVVPARA